MVCVGTAQQAVLLNPRSAGASTEASSTRRTIQQQQHTARIPPPHHRAIVDILHILLTLFSKIETLGQDGCDILGALCVKLGKSGVGRDAAWQRLCNGAAVATTTTATAQSQEDTQNKRRRHQHCCDIRRQNTSALYADGNVRNKIRRRAAS